MIFWGKEGEEGEHIPSNDDNSNETFLPLDRSRSPHFLPPSLSFSLSSPLSFSTVPGGHVDPDHEAEEERGARTVQQGNSRNVQQQPKSIVIDIYT